MLVSRPSVGRIIPVSQVLRYWGNLGKLGPNTPNHVQGHMKSNPKSLAPFFTSNKTLLQCQDPLRVELYLFNMYSGVGAIWGNWARIPPNLVQGHMKSNSKYSDPYFTLNETFLQCQGHLWVELYIPVSQLLRYWGNLWKLGPNTPNHAQGHMKSSLQLHISHQISFYSSVQDL